MWFKFHISAPFVGAPSVGVPLPDMSRKTTTLGAIRDCLLGGSSIVFSALGAVSQFIPVPYLQLAVTAACQIITIAQVSYEVLQEPYCRH